MTEESEIKSAQLFGKSRSLTKPDKSQILRDRVELELSLPKKLVFKLAESRDELSQAFSLLHDSYVDEGYMDPHPSGMRIIKYHALPNSSTLIGLLDGKVVATMLTIRNSAIGLPSNELVDIAELVKDGTRVAEISSLAIHKDYRYWSGGLLFPLIKFLMEYCMRYYGVDAMIISVNPKHVNFYKSILLFDILDQKVIEYNFVKGAPAVLMYLDLRTAPEKWAAYYGNKPHSKNIFYYILKHKFDNYIYPDRSYFKISDPVMTQEMLDYFFNRKTSMLSSLSDSERAALTRIYKHLGFTEIIKGSLTISKNFDNRKHNRYEVNCKGRVALAAGKRFINMKIKDVSLDGFKAFMKEPIRIGELLNFNIEIREFDIADLCGYPIRRYRKQTYGFKLNNSSKNWKEFINFLRFDLNKNAASESIN